jgi:uncharacterized caspase-like protein
LTFFFKILYNINMLTVCPQAKIKPLVLALALFPAVLSAQQQEAAPQKFALVIGNATYTGISPLASPTNDAMRLYFQFLITGFKAVIVPDGTLEEMNDAITQFKDNLGKSKDSYGFFFYAGHAVQSGGDNYLIPRDAEITAESQLPTRAVSVQALLDGLDDAKNSMNVVVLDACRDSPFGWGGERGLAAPDRRPENSIIVYAAGANQAATGGERDNSVFATHVLFN